MQLHASKCSPRQTNVHVQRQQPRKWHSARSASCSPLGTSSTSHAAHATGGSCPSVVLTREHGKNDKMLQELSKQDIQCIELPLIEHAHGPDRPQLPAAVASGAFDWITITSPEAANVLIEAWSQAGKPKLRVAAVGGGTADVLSQAGIAPEFVPSKALGKNMGGELPHVPGGSDRVLYPASCKASTDLQDSLQASGFQVDRMDTYDTRGVSSAPEDLLGKALAADIVTFGSPSAVKAWVSLAGLETAKDKVNVCIGSTSARACEAAGLSKVYFPEAPGIEGWVECVVQQCRSLQSSGVSS
ncbi:tetrapyrrole biosynthesis, uroporphyrinogen III synthase [Dunaliella salina]|uniref:Uroporphyrinogen-III synthase n=1 Tax=Dunaliella salina TaxID=3046 RepID=A0ABQ7GSZ8_DUNSA|nr:tetrapyrrole biosynthesis, uroporphyrinogen III synthase [Dunaliella salina]|eukprot:KAF5837730.1 tetrapyrrole biosynthesis, uroporphyrinogen III synthase [Dunaliella salina]